MNLKFWLKRPHLIASRVRYWFWERANPDKPWLTPGTIRFCEQHFAGSKHGLEFGSGRSTQWFAKLTDRLTSVEHHADWAAQVRQQLERAGVHNVDYLHVPLDHPESDPERPTYDPIPAYVSVVDRFADGSLDFVIVDGHYRTNCVRYCLPKIRPGGYLVVDDLGLWRSLDDLSILRDWPIVDDSTNGIKRLLRLAEANDQ